MTIFTKRSTLTFTKRELSRLVRLPTFHFIVFDKHTIKPLRVNVNYFFEKISTHKK